MQNARILAALSLAATSLAQAQTPASASALVTVENYNRAQTDVYFAGAVKGGGFGKFQHSRELTPPDQRAIIRPNRDTLYSFGVFDLDAGPVTITLPKGAPRFMGMQIVNEDQYTPAVYYGAGTHTLTRAKIRTRSAMAVVRFFVDFSDKQEVQRIHALQDTINIEQANAGTFEVPSWDEASLNKVRAALLQLGTTMSDTRRMYGANKNDVDPVRHLIGSAMLWGGNRERDALYLPITPTRNDGKTVYMLTVKDVPVDGFWSVTVYNSEGYFDANSHDAYSVNSITAKGGSDGSVSIQFGGCDGKIHNCLPITKGWNYTVRLFRPRSEILDESWKFPLAEPVSRIGSSHVTGQHTGSVMPTVFIGVRQSACGAQKGRICSCTSNRVLSDPGRDGLLASCLQPPSCRPGTCRRATCTEERVGLRLVRSVSLPTVCFG